jgi:hypothetical protein
VANDVTGRALVFVELVILNRSEFSAPATTGMMRSLYRLNDEDDILVRLRPLDRRRTTGNIDGTIETNTSGLNGTLETIADAELPDGFMAENPPSSQPQNCNSGFWGNGVVCVDVDECALDDPPCANAEGCVNTEGSYVCICLDGQSYIDNECKATPVPPRRRKSHVAIVPSVVVGTCAFFILCFVVWRVATTR